MRVLWIALPLALALAVSILIFAVPAGNGAQGSREKGASLMQTKPEGYPVAVLAGGCFWCTESEYRRLPGVLFTHVGYTGGHLDNPGYEDTHDGTSGHAEAVEVTYDQKAISYRDILLFFMKEAHDPTQLNRQGPDVGPQYRSAIFYGSAEEKQIAQEVIDELTAAKAFSKPIVTTLEPAARFWEAEEYHQQYYEKYEARTGQPHINDWLKRQGRQYPPR